MKKHYYIALFILLNSSLGWAIGNPTDSTAVEKEQQNIGNLIIDLGTVYYSASSFEKIVSTMALYFDSKGEYYDEFGKPFKEKFPTEYKIMIENLRKSK